jgi:hypothetical protein
MWLTSSGAFATSAAIKLRASDGANLGSFNFIDHPAGIAFDGSNVWIAIPTDGSLVKLRVSDGANLGLFPTTGLTFAVAFDGSNIWATLLNSGKVTRLLPAFPQ